MTDLTPDVQRLMAEASQWQIDCEEFRRERDAAVAEAAILRAFVEAFAHAESLGASEMFAWQDDAFDALREAEAISRGNEE